MNTELNNKLNELKSAIAARKGELPKAAAPRDTAELVAQVWDYAEQSLVTSPARARAAVEMADSWLMRVRIAKAQKELARLS